MTTLPFSCSGIPPKQALALQILGYTVLSLLAENLESEPEAHIHTFEYSTSLVSPWLEDMVESVEISMPLWELIGRHTALGYVEGLYEKLLDLEKAVKTQEDFDKIYDEIILQLREVDDAYNVINEFLEDGGLGPERFEAIEALLTRAPPQAPPHHRGRSHTLRVKGRRAITPMRRRKGNHITNNTTNHITNNTNP
jgi:hypothetical protein